MDNIFSNLNESILLLLVIIIVLLFFIWYLIRDRQAKLVISVEDYNNLVNEIHQLNNENLKLLGEINNLRSHKQKIQINSEPVKSIVNQSESLEIGRKTEESYGFYKGSISELINEFRTGNFIKLFKILIYNLNESSDEYWQVIRVESRWNTIQNSKIDGLIDVNSSILEENKIKNSLLLLIQKIKSTAPNKI